MFYSIEAEATHGQWLTKTTARTIVNIPSGGKNHNLEHRKGEGEGEGEEVERAEEPAPHATLVVGA